MLAAVSRIAAAGAVQCAEKVLEATKQAAITVLPGAGGLVVSAPYSEAFRGTFVPGRRWVREAKAYTVPERSRQELFGALAGAYDGHLLLTARGLFRLAAGKAEAFAP